MKKTALQKLIEKWETFKPKGTPHESVWNAFIDDAKKSLPAEREQIEDAYVKGFQHGLF